MRYNSNDFAIMLSIACSLLFENVPVLRLLITVLTEKQRCPDILPIRKKRLFPFHHYRCGECLAEKRKNYRSVPENVMAAAICVLAAHKIPDWSG